MHCEAGNLVDIKVQCREASMCLKDSANAHWHLDLSVPHARSVVE